MAMGLGCHRSTQSKVGLQLTLCPDILASFVHMCYYVKSRERLDLVILVEFLLKYSTIALVTVYYRTSSHNNFQKNSLSWAECQFENACSGVD